MPLRTIKSYVLRAGRMSPRQTQGLELWLKDYELPVDGVVWGFEQLFGRKAQTVVEIGFGMGASLLTMSQNNPDCNYIGIEVHKAGVGSLAADLHDNQLTNVKIVAHDAVEVLNTQVPMNSLAGIQVFFPDPWHKKRHHKRRLIQPAFTELLAQKVQPGGFIHCATDWEEYAIDMMDVLSSIPSLYNSQAEGGYSPRPDSRPITKFERRGERLGHGVWDLIFIKK